MKQFRVVPTIYRFGKFKEFAEHFKLTERDLILTNRYIYEPVIAKCGISCHTFFQEEYGAGEPTDIMINSILAEIKKCL